MKTVIYKGKKLKVIENLGIKNIKGTQFKILKVLDLGKDLFLKVDCFSGQTFETSLN